MSQCRTYEVSGSGLPQPLAALATHCRLADGIRARQAQAAAGAQPVADYEHSTETDPRNDGVEECVEGEAGPEGAEGQQAAAH